jgi:hypothetical protein
MPRRFVTACISSRSFQTPSGSAPYPAFPLKLFLDGVAMIAPEMFQMSYILLVSLIGALALHWHQPRVEFERFEVEDSRWTACFPDFRSSSDQSQRWSRT